MKKVIQKNQEFDEEQLDTVLRQVPKEFRNLLSKFLSISGKRITAERALKLKSIIPIITKSQYLSESQINSKFTEDLLLLRDETRGVDISVYEFPLNKIVDPQIYDDLDFCEIKEKENELDFKSIKYNV